MKKPQRIVLVAVILLAVGVVAGRVILRKAASDYGRTFEQAVSYVSPSGFADTPDLRRFLASPEMMTPLRRVNALSFLGSGYRVRADELQRGMIYLSEQMALPPAQRFSSPLVLAHLSFDSSDQTDAGIAKATKGLLTSYESQL